MPSVLQEWVMDLPLRHQGVLCASLRGCDLDAKHSLAKPVNRAIRRVVQNPADVRETVDPRAFQHYDPETFLKHIHAFSQGMDGYPLHYVMHMVHALEIIGYKHPDRSIRMQFKHAYERLVFKFHLYTETEEQLDYRLTYDRFSVNEYVDN